MSIESGVQLEKDTLPQIYSLSQPIFLGDEKICVLCSKEEDRDSNEILSLDHVFPQQSCRKDKDPDIFGNVIAERMNWATLCRDDHDVVDFGVKVEGRRRRVGGKIRAYKSKGITGLIDYVANYPRCAEKGMLDRQYFQWVTLFDEVQDQLGITVKNLGLDFLHFAELEFSDPESRKIQKKWLVSVAQKIEIYRKAETLVGWNLFKWNRGDFELEREAA